MVKLTFLTLFQHHIDDLELVTAIWMCGFEVIVIAIEFDYFNLMSPNFNESTSRCQ